MDVTEKSLTETMPRLRQAETSLHNGDVGTADGDVVTR